MDPSCRVGVGGRHQPLEALLALDGLEDGAVAARTRQRRPASTTTLSPDAGRVAAAAPPTTAVAALSPRCTLPAFACSTTQHRSCQGIIPRHRPSLSHPRCGVSSQEQRKACRGEGKRRGRMVVGKGGGGGGGGVTRHATQCAHSLSHRCGGRCGVRSWSSRRRCWCHRRLRSTSASPRYAAPPAPPSSMPAMCAAITRYDGRCGAVRSRQPTATHPAHVR